MSAVAGRYAKALFALAKEGAVVEQTASDLGRVAALADEPSIGAVLRSPLLSTARRQELSQMLARELQLPDLLTRFLGLLAEHQRLGDLPAIHQRFQALLDQELGRVRITIRTASPLDGRQSDELIATFTKLTGKQVIPTVAVEPDLLGGVVVEVEGKVYDGSVRTQLSRLAKELTGTAEI